MNLWQRYCRRLRIWETNFGRAAGWLVEFQGEPIAYLPEPRSVEMFWDSYRVDIVATDPALRQRIATSTFWSFCNQEWRQLVFRNREFDAAPSAVMLAGYQPESSRVVARGLYVPIGWPRPWDWLVLWWRGRGRRSPQRSKAAST